MSAPQIEKAPPMLIMREPKILTETRVGASGALEGRWKSDGRLRA